jgi:DNA-binding MarR family transcriptional regulator
MSTSSSSEDRASPLPLGPLLAQAHLGFTDRVLEGLSAEGFGDLRAAHLLILTYVQGGGSRITSLAEWTHIRKPSVVYLVDDLVQLGYVQREADPTDGRAVLVRPTDHGRNAHRVIETITDQIAANWKRDAAEEDAGHLITTLERLVRAIDAAQRGRR